MSIFQWRLDGFSQNVSLYLYLRLFFENRKNSGLTPGQNDDPVTRWPGRERWPKWPIDPVTQWPSSMSGASTGVLQRSKLFSISVRPACLWQRRLDCMNCFCSFSLFFIFGVTVDRYELYELCRSHWAWRLTNPSLSRGSPCSTLGFFNAFSSRQDDSIHVLYWGWSDVTESVVMILIAILWV